MANKTSTTLTNADAKPPVLPNAHLVRGVVYEAVETIEKAAADTDTHVFRYVRVRSSDRVSQVLVANDALTGATDVDVGLYRTEYEGGAVVDKDLFNDGISLASAAAFTERTAAVDIADCKKRVWELLGLSADPNLVYDLAVTFNTGGTAAGTIAVKVRYCAG